MSVSLSEPVEVERRIEQQLREAVRRHIDRHGLTPELLASHLGMLPAGAEFLMERPDWPLHLAIRIADRLGIRVELSTGSP